MGRRVEVSVRTAASAPPRPSDFDEFVARTGPRVWTALSPQFGTAVAEEAVADAMAYCWQHWDRVRTMANPEGYLYVTARHLAIPRTRSLPVLPAADEVEIGWFEPALLPALAELSEMQRTVVYLVEGCGWRLVDTGRLLGISVSTVRNHLARAMAHLRARLEVTTDV